MELSLEGRFCTFLNPCVIPETWLLKQRITGGEASPASWVSLKDDDT